jgi:Tfp pilus assembly protein PilZ
MSEAQPRGGTRSRRATRGKQVLAAARQAGVSPEVTAAVNRVEHRLGELTQLVQSLQAGITHGVAQAAAANSARGQRQRGQGHAQSQAQGQPQAQANPQAQGRQQSLPVDDGGMLRFDTLIDLTSHSNFYRWSPKGDVVNEGGVFVATRRRPPNIGDSVVLRLQLPGGAELEARGVVEWTRPTGHPGGVPGFGARFADLPTYARQLVDHFVTSRPPLVFEQS